MREYRLTKVSQEDLDLLHSQHKFWHFAQILLKYRPSKPDGYWKGRPYFFFGHDPKRPDAGYHTWWDAPFERIVRRQEDHLDFIFDVGDELEIRGGLGAIISESLGLEQGLSLDEIWELSVERKLMQLIEEIDDKFLTGTWLDLGSGNGVITEKVAKTVGIARIIHVDQNRSLKKEFTALTSKPSEDFIASTVEKLNKNTKPGDIQALGIFILNPYSDDRFLNASFDLAQKTLVHTNCPVVVLCDSEDVQTVLEAALARGFQATFSSRNGKEMIFTRR